MVGPEISRRLTYRENLKIGLYQGVTAMLFTGASVFHNYLTRRPLPASMLKHAGAAILGFIGGSQIDKFVEQRRNVRVLVLEDYISKHPEDFPVAPPKKYKDVLMPWVPVR